MEIYLHQHIYFGIAGTQQKDSAEIDVLILTV